MTFDSFDSYPHGAHKNLFCIDEAEMIAKRLTRLPGVLHVEVYGSIARDTFGNDIDLLIVVDDEEIYRKFIQGVIRRIDEDFLGHELGARLRLASVIALWEKEWQDIVPCSEEWLLDLFVMPNDWKNRLDELQKNLPHDDSTFMHSIAEDARVIASRA